MVDNVLLNSGTGGETLATDDIAGIQHQRVKIQHGSDGSATDVSSASPLPVDNSANTQPVSATALPLPTGAATSAAQLPDGHNVTVDNASGASAVNIQDGGNSITVDGIVTANLGATDNAVLDQIEVNTSYGDNTGGGVELGALRVTLANDSTGLLSVDDNGGSLTIDNTGIDTIAGAVSGTEMQVDILTSSLPTGAATAANQLPDGHNVTIDNAAGAAAVNIQDGGNSITIDGTVTANAGTGTFTVDLGTNNDVIVTGNVAHDTADSGSPVKTGGKAKAFDGTAPGTDVAENDRVDSIHTVDGRQFVEITHPNYWHTSADYSVAQTNATVKAAPGVGLKLYITDIIISNGATAGNITLLDGSGGTVLIEDYPAINGGLTVSLRTPIVLTANTLLAITSTTVTTHTVTVSGFIAA